MCRAALTLRAARGAAPSAGVACAMVAAMIVTAEVASMAHVQDGARRMLVVDVDDPRPMSAAARQVRATTRRPGDLRRWLVCRPRDIVDVTEQVRRDGRMDQRVLVMRGGAFRFESALPAAGGAVGLERVLSRLLTTWNQSRQGGEFTVAKGERVFHIIPISRRGVSGELEPYTPPLSARINMPLEERSGLDTLEQLSRLVAEQTGRPIVAGMMPISLMVRTMISEGARNEPARSVLWRALQQLGPRLSWQAHLRGGRAGDVHNQHSCGHPGVMRHRL